MTSRLPVRALDASGYIGDGAQALHDDGTWKIPAGGGGGGLPSGGTTGQVLTKLSATDGDAGWATPAGGSGGSSVPDLRWTVGAGATSVDEFDDGSIGASWVRVDGTGALAANASWAEGAGALSVKNEGADASQALHALLRPIGTPMAPGDGFITCLRIHGRAAASYSMAGLILADGTTHGTGTQVTADAAFGSAGGPNYDVVQYGWANFTSIPATGTLDNRYSPAAAPLFLRLWMTAANSWQVDTSPNGVQWLRAGYGPRTLTPTHVGFLSTSYGSGVKHIATFEFLRRVSGVS